MNKDDLNRLANVSIRGLVEARNSSEVLIRIQSLTEAARILDARTRVIPENLRNELLRLFNQMIAEAINEAMRQNMKSVQDLIKNSIQNNNTLIQDIINNPYWWGLAFDKDKTGYLYWNGEKIELHEPETCDENTDPGTPEEQL